MPFCIQTVDRKDAGDLRQRTRDEHVAYLTANKSKLLAGGACLTDDRSSAYGGVIIVDTEDRAEAERFIENDPFTKAGLFESYTVRLWTKAYFNHECLL